MIAADLAARIRTVGQLAGIVHAMHTLAGARLRQAEEAATGFAAYASATRAVLDEALALAPAAPSPPGGAEPIVVLLGPEHGFVGGLVERLVEAAVGAKGGSRGELVVLGRRAMRHVRERALDAIDGGSMPSTLGAVAATADGLLSRVLAKAIASRASVTLLFARHVVPISWRLERVRLLPPDVVATPARTAAPPPMHALPAPELVARALEEHCYAIVTWAVADAFASEQAARLSAMDAARRNIDDKLAELRRFERSARQDAITNEILEIATGAELSAGGAR